MFRKIMMGTALIAAVATFDPGTALAQHRGGGGGGHMGGGAHFGGGGGAHFGGGGFHGGMGRGGGGFHGFAAPGGGMRNSFASSNPGVMRNTAVNRSFSSNAMVPRSSNNARMSQNMQYHHWNNGGHHGRHGWRHHRGWSYGGAGLALGYGLYNGYYDDDSYGYYDGDYYGDYAYNDDYSDQCYRTQRYHTRSGWHVRTVNVCQ